MRRRARRPETILGEAMYRWHPLFAGRGFRVWLHGAQSAPATIEGGDVLVIGNGAVLVGMSERTQPQAVEMLAHAAVLGRRRGPAGGHRHAEVPRVHAPGHRADHG